MRKTQKISKLYFFFFENFENYDLNKAKFAFLYL